MTRGSLVMAAAVLGLVACGPKELTWPDPANPVRQDLLIEPANGIFYVDTTPEFPTQAEFDYVVHEGSKDVSEEVTMEAESTIGFFDGNHFKSFPARAPPVRSSLIGALSKSGKSGYAWATVIYSPPGLTQVIGEDGSIPQPTAVVQLGTNVGQIDMAVLMDTTGSMAGAINNLKDNLTTEILPALLTAAKDSSVAIVDHKDYPVGEYGGGSDFPVKVLTRMTPSAAVEFTTAAIDLLGASGGGDLPESQIPAMWHILTGNALSWTGGSVAAAPAPAGTYGAVRFREAALPIVVLITDIDWHGENHDPYSSEVTSPPTMADLKTAFTDRNARFVNITESDGPEDQANELSDATDSNVPPSAFGGKCGADQCCTGVNGTARPPDGPNGTCRLNFLHDNGEGVSDGIANAISGLTSGSSFDISMVVENGADNPDGFDATTLVTASRAFAEGNGTGCIARTATDTNVDGVLDTFPAIGTNTTVCFEVQLAPMTGLTRGPEPKVYTVNLKLVGQPGGITLTTKPLVFYVPPADLVAAP